MRSGLHCEIFGMPRFAADVLAMRHVLVRCRGPYGVEYALKRLEWWAYWREPRPE